MRAPKADARPPKAASEKAARGAPSAAEAAVEAAEKAGGTFVACCTRLDHSRALNNFGNATAILVILAENAARVPREDLNDALWGIRDLIKHGLELLGEEVRS
jgi:hypothetical protein